MTTYLLSPTSAIGSSSSTSSPLSSPTRQYPFQEDHISSMFADDKYFFPSQQASEGYTSSVPLYNAQRRASIAVPPTYQSHYTVVPPTHHRASICAHPSQPPLPLTIHDQESLPSWRRDFDKMADTPIKARWGQDLYRDFRAGRIPVTGRMNLDVFDWETCVAKVNGMKNAEATAKMLVAAQERKAELQAAASRGKVNIAEKEPPRRQNKFICYRSLRSTQLAAYFTNFKQSQFSAITSHEWKEIDTDWWGEVANLVEEVRRAKYIGQLDDKGNPIRRESPDRQLCESIYATPDQPIRMKKTKSGKISRKPSMNRFEPYANRPLPMTMAMQTPPARLNMARTVSYNGQSAARDHLTPPTVHYRHSIDMGHVPLRLANQYPSSPAGRASYDHEYGATDMLGLYQTPVLSAAPHRSLAIIPATPLDQLQPSPAFIPTQPPSQAYDPTRFTDPFAFNASSSSMGEVMNHEMHSATASSCSPPNEELASPPYEYPPSLVVTAPGTGQDLHGLPVLTMAQPAPQIYVAPPSWNDHSRDRTNELMERYTMAQDYVPLAGPVVSQCYANGREQWTGYYDGMMA